MRAAQDLIACTIAAVTICSAQSAYSGGLLGDLINKVAPGVGTKLDDLNREIKNALPPYKAIEEGVSTAVQEAVVEATARCCRN